MISMPHSCTNCQLRTSARARRPAGQRPSCCCCCTLLRPDRFFASAGRDSLQLPRHHLCLPHALFKPLPLHIFWREMCAGWI